VYINQTASFATTGTQANLTFDPQFVQLKSVEKAPSFSTAALQAGVYMDGANRNQTLAEAIAEANTTGTLKGVTAYYIVGSGEVAKGENSFLTFRMTALKEGTSPLTLSETEMIDTEFNSVQITATNGQVAIQLGAPTQTVPTPAVAATLVPKTGSTAGSTVLGTHASPGTTAAKSLPRAGDRLNSRGSYFALLALFGAACSLASGGAAIRQWARLRRRSS